MSNTFFSIFLSAALLCGLSNCATETAPVSLSPQVPLVRVGIDTIRVSQLLNFERDLPEYLRTDRGGQDQHLRLQSLVDRRLMVIEARIAGLETDVRAEVSDQLNKRLIAAIVVEEIDRKLHFLDEELREAYEEYELGWEVWPAHILSATEEDALAVIAALEEGENFAKLARERSLADDADQGGDLRGYFGKGDALPALRENTFHLAVGEASVPIETRDGFEVVKVLDKRRTPFEQMRDGIARQMHSRKWAQRRAEYSAELSERYHVQYFGANFAAVLEGMRRKPPLAAARGESDPIVVYDSGAIDVQACIDALHRIKKGPLPPDSLALSQTLKTWIVPDSLMVLVARAENRHEDASLLAWQSERWEEALVRRLYEGTIASQVTVDDDEARAYYTKHLDTYSSLPGEIEMTEVLVSTEEEALQVLERARAGESLELLSLELSLRPSLPPVGGHAYSDSGHLSIQSLYQSPYRTYFGDSNEKDVGVLQGPMLVQEKYYSVFRLDQPIVLRALPFRQVQRPIRMRIRETKEGVIFKTYVDSLRAAHRGEIEWFEENLALLSEK